LYYTIYRTTNKINGKFYIGKHQTKNLNDGYMGSGKLLKRAIKKYGVDNFTKEILFIFDNEEDMNSKEKELVVLGESSYNLCEGGNGGFGYINRMSEILAKRDSKAGYVASFEAMTNSEKNVKAGLRSKEMKVGIHNPMNKYDWTGKKHKPETIEKMRLAAKRRTKGY
jgi:group I intron endonuclease